jgi:hypothetical protein
MQLLAATEMAFFERILELGDESALHEREDISRAIDVVLDLKAAQASSKMPTVSDAGSRESNSDFKEKTL